jgi:hypothetical protein
MFKELGINGLGVVWLRVPSQDWKDIPVAAKKMLPEGSTLSFFVEEPVSLKKL